MYRAVFFSSKIHSSKLKILFVLARLAADCLMLKTFLFCLLAFVQVTAFAAEPSVASERTPPNTSTWTCQAFYLPARSIWQRTIAIEYDGAAVRSVQIDGVAVYTFNLNGSSLMTAVDGERIQFDVAALTWTSDLRGLVSASGRCAP